MFHPYFLSPEDFLEDLKKAAKTEKKLSGNKSHSKFLDEIARLTGFSNWSVFHKRVSNLGILSEEYQDIRRITNSRLSSVLPFSIKNYVVKDIFRFMNSSYEKLDEFSVPNATTEIGYSHPTADFVTSLESEYGRVYEADLINYAIKIVYEHGPWCIDDSEIMIDEYSNYGD